MFSAVEWMIALRYMRARRSEGFISVIAGFSLLGIALGVATLIIVLSVMNGFRSELLDRILGLNGHVSVVSATGNIAGTTRWQSACVGYRAFCRSRRLWRDRSSLRRAAAPRARWCAD